VTKVPRFAFEKFPEADPTLTTQMKSVGEVMSIGRTFKESLQKAIRSLEIDSSGFEERESDQEELRERLKEPNSDRLWYIAESMREGMSIEEIYDVTKIDPWFLNNIREIIDFEADIATTGPKINKDPDLLLKAKSFGFSDRRIAELTGMKEADVRNARDKMGMRAAYKMVDTCAAEFEAYTPYLYSTYERPFYKIADMSKDSRSERLSVETHDEIQGFKGSSEKDEVHSNPRPLGPSNPVFECEANPSDRKKIMILGSGPNRIGQGIEFDYCCVHAVFSLKDEGFETIMVNCNPETVSTDYDTSDRLYFEPLTLEDVLNIIEVEKPEGVIVQFGGQTPLKLAVPLEEEGVKILGTPPDAIDRAEDRKRFKDLLHKLNLRQPESGTAMSSKEAVKVAGKIGYPAMVRPSYVLGGRAMEIVYDEESLKGYMKRAVKASPEHPVLVDKYIVDATEVDVDAVCDGDDVIIGGVMEHIEAAGIHSGDSACSLPPYSLSPGIVAEIKEQTRALAQELGVVGLMNIQFAVKDNDIYIIEVNPRASRTVPFVSKATGIPLAKVAAKVMAGMKLKDIGLTSDPDIDHVAIKEAVFPFDKFSNVDTILGPEMKSTGEVMGIDSEFGIAYAKAESSARNQIPMEGKLFLSVRDEDKPRIQEIARTFIDHGFGVVATRGTAAYLQEKGIDAEVINKLKEGRPNVVDLIKNKEISFIINTIESASAQADSFYIRQSALQYRVSYTTTMSGARAVANAVDRLKNVRLTVKSLQEYHAGIRSLA
jgi:carbamoyl-phosphate synthase large subunit